MVTSGCHRIAVSNSAEKPCRKLFKPSSKFYFLSEKKVEITQISIFFHRAKSVEYSASHKFDG